MNNLRLSTMMLLPAVLAAASGCSGGAGFGFGRTVSSDLTGVVQESDEIQQAAIADASSAAPPSAFTATDASIATVSATSPANHATTTLTSAKLAPSNIASRETPHKPVGPALITLPPNGDLESVLAAANGNVLLDFYADWCGPCRKQAVILHELEETAAENDTLIVKVNVDEHKQIAREMQISSLPTLVMVKDGEIVKRQTGLARKVDLVHWMQ
ncbi:thioredoxin family protein [Novipirellula rosea]|uniref:thioredoxin family protein n=1 Tax=Novipirellula rosea TaxID=1031540 RepID=UPI0031EFFB62